MVKEKDRKEILTCCQNVPVMVCCDVPRTDDFYRKPYSLLQFPRGQAYVMPWALAGTEIFIRYFTVHPLYGKTVLDVWKKRPS